MQKLKTKTMKELIKLINDSGLSDLQLSRLTGIHRSNIYKIRNNKIDPKLSTATKIVEAIEGIYDKDI